MPAASRHAKPKKHARPAKRRLPVLAAATTLACLAVAFICLHGGSAAPAPAHDATHVASGMSAGQVTLDARQVEYHVQIQHRMAAQRKHLAAVAAARLARKRAASAAASPSALPAPPASTISTGGSDPAASALGKCVRDTEEGGSYAWGRGNGGGAYQFLLGTWEKYGGTASQYGVAGAAYQNQVFDNAVRAGGASNWTDYDGC